jgi:3-oxoacyl-[acyl-carrier protein] reductase
LLLKEMTALVTGSTRGIGKGIALCLAREGATVAINGRKAEETEKVTEELRKSGFNALSCPADISQAAQVEGMARVALDALGKIDILVNNAGISQVKPTLELTEEEWDRMFAVILKGPFLCVKALAPQMIERRSGVIINIASDAAKTGGIVDIAHYAAAKAGLVSLTKSLAREFAPFGIRVNAVSPGLIRTSMVRMVSNLTSRVTVAVPLGRLGEPEEVGEAVAFLASNKASYITGEILDVNGGKYMD